MADATPEEKRKSAYSSRLSRARSSNAERGRLTRTNTDSMANMAFSIPVQAEVDHAAAAAAASRAASVSYAPPARPTQKLAAEPTVYIKPEGDMDMAVHWEWNAEQKMCATTDHNQLLKVIDSSDVVVEVLHYVMILAKLLLI